MGVRHTQPLGVGVWVAPHHHPDPLALAWNLCKDSELGEVRRLPVGKPGGLDNLADLA